jgi:hypothetical protein
MDDDKQNADPDPWAGLGSEGEGQTGGEAADAAAADDAAFIFDMLGEDAKDDEPSGSADERSAAAPAGDDVDDGVDGVPLAVFPPPDADFGTAEEESADNAAPAAVSEPADGDALFPTAAEDGFSGFDDRELERDADDPFADVASVRGEEPDDEGAEFGGGAAFPTADDVSFNTDAQPTGDASPFADLDREDSFAHQPESAADGLASIPLATAATAAANVTNRTARKKKSGLGQLAGVALGGVMALPVTYAILLWGFQKDPFKLARKLPDQVSFLVPQSLRQGAAVSVATRAAPARATGPSLDDLPTAGVDQDAETPSSEAMATDDAAESAAAEDPDAVERTDMAAETAAPADAAGQGAGLPTLLSGRDVPPELAAAFLAALEKFGTIEEVQAALVRLSADEQPAPAVMPAEPQAAAPPVSPPESAPLDLSAVEAAAARATAAIDSLEAADGLDDQARERLMVAWYRRLATLGEQFAVLETAAVDSGRPLDAAPEVVDAALDRIRSSPIAVERLRDLGRMWLATRKRRADGAVLVATVQASRQLGPYWSTAVNVAEADGTERTVAVVSRVRPTVDVGDMVLVTGVLFDTDTVWASDVRPLDAAGGTDAEMPGFSVPPTFDEPVDSVPLAEPPMLDDAAGGEGREPAAVPEPTAEADGGVPPPAPSPAADAEPKADATPPAEPPAEAVPDTVPEQGAADAGA